MTDEDVVRNFHAIVGFGSVGTLQPPGKRKKVWVWSAYGENAVKLMGMFVPYLGQRRTAIAARLLLKYSTRPTTDPAFRKQRSAKALAARYKKVWRA